MDFQEQIEALQNSLKDNMGNSSDSILKDIYNEERPKKRAKETPPKPIPKIEEHIEDEHEPLVIVQEENTPSIPEEYKEEIIDLVKRVTLLENELSEYKNRPIIKIVEKEEKTTSETELFNSMLDIYQYSVVINPKLNFKTELYEKYKEHLMIISQNILANSFRFFEKKSIIEESIEIGEEIEKEYNIESKSLYIIQKILIEMNENLLKPSYQKNLYFAKFLNERGLILNSVSIIHEILGEYLVASAKNLSSHANERVIFHLNRINNSQTSRRGYYQFYKSVTTFFYTQFNSQSTEPPTTFFPYRDSGNDEIELNLKRIFQANKRRKANLFSLYSELIYRIKIIRNDLVHGNNQRIYHNILYEIEDVLIDFEYLAINKNFLGA